MSTTLSEDEIMLMNYTKPVTVTPKPNPIPMKTMFRWRDGENRRTAIQTATGVVQVKIVEDGLDRGQISTFPDYDAWTKSLPSTGEITAYEHDQRTVLEKRLDMPRPPYKDVTLVFTLIGRFKITSYAWSMPSIQNELDTMHSYAQYYNERIQKTLQEGGEEVLLTNSRKSLKKIETRVAKLEALSRDMGQERSLQHPYKFRSRGRTQLYVQVKGALREIAYYLGKIVDFHEHAYDSFAEMGADMVEGQPMLFIFRDGNFYKVK